MDRAMIEQHLVLAEEHVSLGERHVSRQREIIATLEHNEHDTTAARELLAIFEDSLRLHIEGRDRILAELAASSP